MIRWQLILTSCFLVLSGSASGGENLIAITNEGVADSKRGDYKNVPRLHLGGAGKGNKQAAFKLSVAYEGGKWFGKGLDDSVQIAPRRLRWSAERILAIGH